MEEKRPLRLEEDLIAGVVDGFGRVQESIYRIPVGIIVLLFFINTGNGYAFWASGEENFPDPSVFSLTGILWSLVLFMFPPYLFFLGWVSSGPASGAKGSRI
jgi:hypothetical protein